MQSFVVAGALLSSAKSNGDDPSPGNVSWWVVLGLAVFSAFCGWMHRRWLVGRPFMSRFTTLERERSKMLIYGYSLLPDCIAIGAMAILLASAKVVPISNPLVDLLLLIVFFGFLVAGGWAIKEWNWPTERRTPTWVRDVFPNWVAEQFGRR